MIKDLVVFPYPLVAIMSTGCSVPVSAGVPLAVPVIAPVFASILKPVGSPVAVHEGVNALTVTEYPGWVTEGTPALKGTIFSILITTAPDSESTEL
jgi:hypothetical protein